MHVKFPFQVTSGTVALADDDEWVVGLIEQVLFTIPGERVNLPQFGCWVEQLTERDAIVPLLESLGLPTTPPVRAHARSPTLFDSDPMPVYA